jgi:formylglycine-generating enzyme required for sulfatase activity
MEVATYDPPPPRQLNPQVPIELSKLVMKLLEKDPGRRIASAEQLVEALQGLEQEGKVPGRQGDKANERESLGRTATLPPPPPVTKRRPLAVPVVAGTLLAALVVLAVVFWPRAENAVPGPLVKDPAAKVPSAPDAPPLASAPFDAVKAKEHQAAWAKYLGVAVEIENSLGMKFRLIPPGDFMMGTPQGDLDEHLARARAAGEPSYAVQFLQMEGPHRPISIHEPFYFGVCEVTQQDWQKLMGEVPSITKGADLPVGNITWLEALTFCNRLSEREKRTSCYKIEGDKVAWVGDDGYRLPLAEEWEYACRAGTTSEYFFGDDPALLGKYAWFLQNSTDLKPVGRNQANPFGLFDIYGNAWEYTHKDRTKVNTRFQRHRGGSIGSDARGMRSATTSSMPRDKPLPSLGMRVLLPLPRAKTPSAASKFTNVLAAEFALVLKE